ncbi:MAG: hypothetical protein Tsb0034_17310 [Ekhidna sp.]
MPNQSTPNWLKELQQKSWEPEILLSGIVLYGMFQLPELLDSFLLYFKSNIFGRFSDVDNLISVLKVGIYWLITGLIIHLFSRGVWIGFVGLSYTFPKSVRTEKLPYTGRFLKKVKTIPQLVSIVDRLEKVSSSIFSLSFLLFMIVLGGYFYVFFLLALPYILLVAFLDFDFDHPFFTYYQYVYSGPLAVLGVIAFIDFISLGALKRVKFLEPVYWPLHRFISLFTLSRIYRNIYYVFASNLNKWVLAISLILLSIGSIVITVIDANSKSKSDRFTRIELWDDSPQYSIYSGYYDNMNHEAPSLYASIQSDVIDGNTIKLFIVADIDREEMIKEYGGYDSLLAAMPDAREEEIQLQTVKNFYHVYMDDSLIANFDPLFYYKDHTNQRGYMAYLNITGLKKGLHEIKLTPPPEKLSNHTFSLIRFFRE